MKSDLSDYDGMLDEIEKKQMSYEELKNNLGIAAISCDPELHRRLVEEDEIGNLVKIIIYTEDIKMDFRVREPEDRDYSKFEYATYASQAAYKKLRDIILDAMLSRISSPDYSERLKASLEFFENWGKPIEEAKLKETKTKSKKRRK